MRGIRACDAFVLILIIHICATTALPQQLGGAISGRVIGEDGQPLANAKITVIGINGRTKQTSVTREATTNDEGDFVVEGLESLPYLISAWSPGYVPGAQSNVLNPFEVSEQHYMHIGERLTVRLIRGGVVTGRVTNDVGEAVIGVPVKATRISDEKGRSTITDVASAHLWTRTTDDRGVYRIYGLAPGSYVVAAGGRDASSSRLSPFAGRTTTYHPSSTRDAATVVNVSSGIESTGVDIRYRGERGFVVSGRIHATERDPHVNQEQLLILLRNAKTGETVDTTNIQSISNQNAYAFYGVPNGEYEIITRKTEMYYQSPLRVTVKNADVAGVDLKLVPNATISGLVALQEPSGVLGCKNERPFHPEEIIVRFRRDEPQAKMRDPLQDLLGYGVGIPYDKGAFTINDLTPGRHRIGLALPVETWYVKTMSITDVKPPIDPRNGLTVKSGDNITELRITIAADGATLKGRLTAHENVKLPTCLRVHLVPAEADALDDVLRFAETEVDADGTFNFLNLSPGKYYLLTRRSLTSESNDKVLRPVAWEPNDRKTLRKDAEAANVAIELKPCQSVSGYTLPFIR